MGNKFLYKKILHMGHSASNPSTNPGVVVANESTDLYNQLSAGSIVDSIAMKLGQNPGVVVANATNSNPGVIIANDTASNPGLQYYNNVEKNAGLKYYQTLLDNPGVRLYLNAHP